ncbi:MAG: protein kinase [Bdellovibrionales bacterium]|nr:protein kinase [Bdellovibrionales bacterium]
MTSPASRHERIDSFGFAPGRILAGKYEVVDCLGAGWEGEVYKVRELATGIERAIKFFFPHRQKRKDLLRWYANKLHKFRGCPMVIQYQTQDTMRFRGQQVTFLVSEFVEGVLLKEFLKQRRGMRLTPFEGLHLLHALACGMEAIHLLRDYHGDLHLENVIVCRQGLRFDLKLLDLYHWNTPNTENIQDDVCDLVRIFYEATGGKKHYKNQPQFVKDICCGLKRSLILKKFRTAGHLRKYLENIEI